MADEVNQFAFEGGDTEAETKAAIGKRNEALQTLADKNREAMEKLNEAQQEAYDNTVAAERETAAADNDLTMSAAAPSE